MRMRDLIDLVETEELEELHNISAYDSDESARDIDRGWNASVDNIIYVAELRPGYELYSTEWPLKHSPRLFVRNSQGDTEGCLDLFHMRGKRFCVDGVMFKAQAQNKGLGTALYGFVLDHGYLIVSDVLHTAASQALWSKLCRLYDVRCLDNDTPGARVTDTAVLYGGDHRTTRLIARKPPTVTESVENAYSRDNPGGAWLKNAQEDAERAPRRYKMLVGKVTARLGSRGAVSIATDFLAAIPGSFDEQRIPGEGQFERLLKRVEENGFDPDHEPILVGVNHYGLAYILEGNTRVAVARHLGIESLNTEVRWFNGGEDAPGRYTPAAFLSHVTRG